MACTKIQQHLYQVQVTTIAHAISLTRAFYLARSHTILDAPIPRQMHFERTKCSHATPMALVRLEDDLFYLTPATPLGRGVVPARPEVFVVSGAAVALAEEPRVFQPLAASALGLHTGSMLSNPNSRNLLP